MSAEGGLLTLVSLLRIENPMRCGTERSARGAAARNCCRRGWKTLLLLLLLL